MKGRFLFVIGLIGLSTALCGQRIKFASFIKLDISSGLSSPNVRKIVKDQFGFLWFATQDGINRYDGNNFIQFNNTSENKGRISNGSDFHDLVVDDSRNTIWAATSNGAINSINTITCTVTGVYPLHEQIHASTTLWYKSLFMADQTLFVAAYQGYIFQLDPANGKLISFTDLFSITQKKSRIEKLYVSGEKIWVFTEQEGALVLNKKDYSLIKGIDATEAWGSAFADISWKEVIEFDSATLLAATNHGILALNTRSIQPAQIPHELEHLGKGILFCATNALQLDSASRSMYLSNSKGVFRTKSGQNETELILNSGEWNDRYWFNNVFCLLEESNGLWLGNQQGIAWVRNIESPYQAYHSSFNGSNVRMNHCYHLLPINDSIVISCAADGLYKVNTYNGVIVPMDNSQPYYQAIQLGNDILASGEQKLYLFSNGTKKEAWKKYPELQSIKNDFIIASCSFKDSLLFMASQNKKGLYVWNIPQRKLDVIREGHNSLSLKSVTINSLHLDKEDRLWIICEDLVSVYDIQQATIRHEYIHDKATGQLISILMDVCEVGGRRFLAAYGKGIIEIDSTFAVKKTITFADGLSNTGIYKLYACNDSLLATGSNNGLFLYNIENGFIKRISDKEGLSSNSFDETSGAERAGYVYFGGLNGLTRICKEKIKGSLEKPVCYFSGVSVEVGDRVIDTFNIFLQQVKMPADFKKVIINYSCICYSNPDKASFYYRIKDLHQDWISLGNQHSVSLLGIYPGAYKIELKALTEDGIYSTPIELSLIFLPKWYQTWWFKSIIAILIMAILYGLYRYRLAQIKMEQQIRQRIASDLHDDIGSTLNSVKVFANLALMKPENNTGYLQQLKEGVQGAIVGVRDMVWVLDDKQDTIMHLSERIEQFIIPLAAAQNISFEKRIDSAIADKLLKKEEKRNLYLIIKETLNNSIKYADASLLELIIAKTSHEKFSIIIRDNGKGFDHQNINKGNGLNNLQYRAKQVRYSITIDTAPGEGVTVTLQKN